jgi:site-specific recombinase XerD
MSSNKKITRPIPLFDTHASLQVVTLSEAYQSETHQTDFEKAIAFLQQYSGSDGTFRAYRREIERLLQWAWLVCHKSILTIERQDIEAYILFCQRPPIGWIGTKVAPRFVQSNGERVPNPNWRLFVATTRKANTKLGIKAERQHYQLSDKSLREIFTILNSFYTYLLHDRTIGVNPVALIRQKNKYFRKAQTRKQVMKLSEKQWQYCLSAAETLAKHNPKQHERTVFILNILYLLYLRISELVDKPQWTPLMAHFFQDAQDFWWFITLGKGGKERLITVSDAMLMALKRYRTHLGLSALPRRNEDTPLIPKIRGKGGISYERDIRKIVQGCFDAAATALREKGFDDEAESLDYATVHWLRHTGISDDINRRQRPIAHVRDDAGHQSIFTTDRYNDVDLKERYLSGKDKKMP